MSKVGPYNPPVHTRWKKGQSGNPKGARKKNYKEHIEDIKKMGYTPPTRGEYYEMIGMLMAMEEDDMMSFSLDKGRPYWIRLIALGLNDKRERYRLTSEYRDWMFGQAKQNVDLGVVVPEEWDEEKGDPMKFVQKVLRGG